MEVCVWECVYGSVCIEYETLQSHTLYCMGMLRLKVRRSRATRSQAATATRSNVQLVFAPPSRPRALYVSTSSALQNGCLFSLHGEELREHSKLSSFLYPDIAPDE